MAALITFVIILFAPTVGVEPGFIDNAASRVILEPKWVPALATLFGALVEVTFLWRLFRMREHHHRMMLQTMAITYGSTVLLALVARFILGSSFLDGLIVARDNQLTPAAWTVLGVTAAWLFLGGTVLGAVVLSHFSARIAGIRRALMIVVVENTVSLAGMIAGLFVLARFR